MIVLLVVLTFSVAVKVRRYVRDRACQPEALTVIDDPAQLDDLHEELGTLDPEKWVRRYHPGQSSGGYNLVLFRRRVPMIVDMNGRVIHSWPKVRATGRVRLNRDGSLAVIGSDNLLKEYTWGGELRWYFQLPDRHDLPHHDLYRMKNDDYLFLVQDGHSHADYLIEVDRRGRVSWEWRFEDHTDDFPAWNPNSTDPSHANSIRELPANRWYDGGDERFRPGNILVSARNLNTIFIIDKTTGDVVWTYRQGLDRQHEAAMLDRGLRGAGLVMVFNNGLDNLVDYRRSKVLVINPVSGKQVWEYGSDYFFSSVGGTAQALPGNSVLVTSSHGGRVFEVRDRRRIVWEWVPPYLPMRVERVPYNHCPQLAALPVPTEIEVTPRDSRPFVDAELYQFDFTAETEERKIGDHSKRVLRSTEGCRDLRIPAGATLRTEFGFDAERLAGRSVQSRFRLTIDDHERPPETLVDTTMDETSDPLWRQETLPIGHYDMREVTMCIETEINGNLEDPKGVVVWADPRILSKSDRERRVARSRRITEQERRLREQQLRALGYVD